MAAGSHRKGPARRKRSAGEAGEEEKKHGHRRAARASTRGEDPVVARVRSYLQLYRAATRRYAACSVALSALEARGLPRMPSYRIGNRAFLLADGDTSAIAAYFDELLAAAPDAAAKARIAQERDVHLAAAARGYEVWLTVARETGAEAALERSDRAWARVDAVDLEALWSARPRSRPGAVAILRLVRAIGWEAGGETGPGAGPRRALAHVIAFLEANARASLRAPRRRARQEGARRT